eukprot:860765-Prymnesium_polylepis.1
MCANAQNLLSVDSVVIDDAHNASAFTGQSEVCARRSNTLGVVCKRAKTLSSHERHNAERCDNAQIY